jgi:hypothetical protein
MHSWENVRLSIGSRPSLELGAKMEPWSHGAGYAGVARVYALSVVKACPGGAIFTGPSHPAPGVAAGAVLFLLIGCLRYADKSLCSLDEQPRPVHSSGFHGQDSGGPSGMDQCFLACC